MNKDSRVLVTKKIESIDCSVRPLISQNVLIIGTLIGGGDRTTFDLKYHNDLPFNNRSNVSHRFDLIIELTPTRLKQNEID